MSEYRWQSPLEWLIWKFQDHGSNEIYSALILLAKNVDSDTIQDLFQADMEADGYFEPANEVEKEEAGK